MPSRRITATRLQAGLALLASGLAAALIGAAPAYAAQAQPAQKDAGYVANLSGPLFAVKADGTRRVLSIRSVVHPGETLITEDKTYARVRFTDTSDVTLRPGTQFKIEKYSFERSAPKKDSLLFRLVKGALRTVTGLIGKRGNESAYRMSTSTATIGIRGTVYGVTVCLPGTCGGLAPGTYVNVIEGAVGIAPPPLPPPPTVTIPTVPGQPPVPVAPPPKPAARPLVLSAGQFGYAPSAGPAVKLPGNPGGAATHFSPPPSFINRPDAPPPGQPATTTKPTGRSSSGECEVR